MLLCTLLIQALRDHLPYALRTLFLLEYYIFDYISSKYVWFE